MLPDGNSGGLFSVDLGVAALDRFEMKEPFEDPLSMFTFEYLWFGARRIARPSKSPVGDLRRPLKSLELELVSMLSDV